MTKTTSRGSNSRRLETNIGRAKANDNQGDQQKCLSPSQRIIKEFKKRELHKYGIVRSSPVETKTNMTEWRALYTTQLTQKAKRYHDGSLQMAPNARQIILFDEAGKLLEAKFLKKAELVKSGESILFDAYLVQVGEHQEIHKSHSDIVEEKEVQKQQDCFKNNEIAEREWNVLYTTHVTQKAKKYHDGFLKLEMRGSIRGKALLYDVNRRVLDTKFLKPGETIKSGESFVFGAHLVDIGEPEGHSEVIVKPSIPKKNRFIPRKTGFAGAQHESLKANNCSLKGKSQCHASVEKDALSDSVFCSVDERSLNKAVTERPCRNALQILSVLQKPMDLKTANLTSITKALISENSCIQDDSGNLLLPSSLTCQVSNKDEDDKNSSKFIDMEKSLHFLKHEGAYSQNLELAMLSAEDVADSVDNSHQANSGWTGNARASGVSNSSVFLFRDPDDHKRKRPEEIKNGEEADECPSFDLGF